MTKQEALLNAAGVQSQEALALFVNRCAVFSESLEDKLIKCGLDRTTLRNMIAANAQSDWLADEQSGAMKRYALSFGHGNGGYIDVYAGTKFYLRDDVQFFINTATFVQDLGGGVSIWESPLDVDAKKLCAYFEYLQGDDMEIIDEDEYFRCERCGAIERLYNSWSVNSGTRREHYTELWCEDCKDNHAFRCDECGKYYDDSLYEGTETACGDTVCEDCYDRYWTTCERCGAVIRQDDAIYSDEYGYLCEECYDETGEARIRQYHNNPTRHYHTLDGEICWDKYIGCEVETECGDMETRCDITQKYGQDEYYIYQMRDGSLDSTGIECITQPMSKKFFDRFRFEEWFKELTDAGARSHDTNDCGLHIHLSKEWFGSTKDKQELTAGTVIAIMDALEQQLKTFARRGSTTYCHYPNDSDFSYNCKRVLDEANKQKWHSAYADKIKKAGKRNLSRYDCLNTQNEHTYEFRIFRGTLNPKTFRASVALCLRLVEYAKYKNRNHSRTYSWQQFKTFKRMPKVLAQYIELKNL